MLCLFVALPFSHLLPNLDAEPNGMCNRWSLTNRTKEKTAEKDTDKM